MRKLVPALAAAIAMSISAAAFADDVQPATAQPVGVQPVAAQPAAAADSERQICRTVFHEGMLIRSNVCHTQKQWDEIRRAQERDVANFQNRTFTQQPK